MGYKNGLIASVGYLCPYYFDCTIMTLRFTFYPMYSKRGEVAVRLVFIGRIKTTGIIFYSLSFLELFLMAILECKALVEYPTDFP